jgi:hypothetical protein
MLVRALAGKGGREGWASLVGQHLILHGGDAAGGADARAPYERDARRAREALARLQHDERPRACGRRQGVDGGRAVAAGQQADPDAIAQALDGERDVGEDRVVGSGGVDAERERLLLLDPLVALVRVGVDDRRPAGRE